MNTLESLRHTIDTVEDLQSIVRTMKVLAAVSIRQYDRAVESLADYNRTVEMGLYVALRQSRQESGRRRPPGRQGSGAVVFGSDHGLCGRFNEAVTAFAVEAMDDLGLPPEDRQIVAVGARTAAILESSGQRLEETLTGPGSAAGITAVVRRLLLKIDQWHSTQGVSDVLLFYNVHRPGTSYSPAMLHLLPVDTDRFRSLGQRPWPSRVLPTHTMDREQLLAALIRQYIFVSVFRGCAESLASEHASRLISMQIAEKNIQERLDELATEFRQRRQDQITEELLDVVAGYEALTGEID